MIEFGPMVTDETRCKKCDELFEFENFDGLGMEPGICSGCAEDFEEHQAESAEERQKRLYEKRLKEAIPDYYRKNHLEGDIPEVLERIVETIGEARDPRGAYLHGSPGTGKTTYLCRTVSRVLWNRIDDPDFRCRYTTELWLKHDLKSRFGRDDLCAEDLLEEYLSADLLVIDELGKASHTDWTLETLFMTVNQRTMRGKTTIFGSNYSIKGLRGEGSDLTGDSGFGVDLTSKIWEIAGRGDYIKELTTNWRLK